jgi:hypothetical protein
MVLGSNNVEICEPIKFEYNPEQPYFLDNQDGAWDTPYGKWKNNIDDNMSDIEIKGGQKVNSADCMIDNSQEYGWVNWSAVKPEVKMISSDDSVVHCEGMECEAVGEGVATITAQIGQTQARMWGWLFFTETGYYGTSAFVKYNYNQCKLITVHGMEDDCLSVGAGVPGVVRPGCISCKDCTREECYERDEGILTLPSPQTPMSWTVNVSPDSSGVCVSNPGKCNPTTNGQIFDNAPIKDLCCDPTISNHCATKDDYVQPKIATDNEDGTYSWSCLGTYGGEADNCETINCAKCGVANDIYTDSAPNSGLCSNNNFLLGAVNFSTDGDSKGMWYWICKNTSAEADCQKVICTAPSCFSENPLTANPSFIYEGESNSSVVISVDCPNDDLLCCDLGDPYNNVQICNGDSREIQIPKDADQTTIDALCGGVPYSITIQTMCMSKSCNAQGTCQARPLPRGSDNCVTTCNSNADCTSGSIIETKP